MDDKMAEITLSDLNYLKSKAAVDRNALISIESILATSMKPKKKLKKIGMWIETVNDYD